MLDVVVGIGLGVALTGACFAAGWRAAARRAPTRPGERRLQVIRGSERDSRAAPVEEPARPLRPRAVNDR